MKEIAAFFILLLFSILVNADTRDHNEVVLVHKEDPVMVQAIKEAQATLDGFLELYYSKTPDVQSYKLKVMLSDENGVEHFWVQPFRASKPNEFEGILANEPVIAKTFKSGELVSFDKSMITDWGYVENGKQFGSYTVCALFKSMPKDQVEYYRSTHGFQC